MDYFLYGFCCGAIAVLILMITSLPIYLANGLNDALKKKLTKEQYEMLNSWLK